MSCPGRQARPGRSDRASAVNSCHEALAGQLEAVRAIHAHARGLPRAINRLAINALLAAYTAGKTIADESSARTAIAEETATD